MTRKYIKLIKHIIIFIGSLFILNMISGCDSATKETKHNVPIVDYLQVSPQTATISVGTTQPFTAYVYGSNNHTQSVVWNISGNNVSSTSINPLGWLSIAHYETASHLTVRATSTDDPSKSGFATVEIVHINDVVVNPSLVNIARGGTQYFTAIVNGVNNPPQNVTWDISGNISSETVIYLNGLLSVAIDESASTIIVRATSTHYHNISGSATVSVQ